MTVDYSLNAIGYNLLWFGGGTSERRDSDDPIDITKYVETIDKATDVGHGQIPTCKIMLDSREGEFITKINSDIPNIQQYDILGLVLQDNSGNVFRKYYLMDDESPQLNETGNHVILNLVGLERHLQKMYFTGKYLFISFSEMLDKILTFYNANRGSMQPGVGWIGQNLYDIPRHTFGTFDFGAETTVFDAIQEVVRRLALPVAAGGAGEVYSVVEDTVLTFIIGTVSSSDSVALRIIPRGKRRSLVSPHPIITKPVIKDPMGLTRTKSPEEGNIVVVRGQPGSGSYPKAISEFRGLLEEFQNIPEYDENIRYRYKAYAQRNGRVFQAIDRQGVALRVRPPAGPNSTASWRLTYFATYVQDRKGSAIFQYSPWTQHKSALWKNWGGNAAGSRNVDYSSLCFPDSNLTIRENALDTGTASLPIWRDWVDFRITSRDTRIPSKFGDPYTGMRVLVDGSPNSTFASRVFGGGTDTFGQSYTDAMVQYSETGKWIVFRRPHHFDQCAVLTEGKVYSFIEPLITNSLGYKEIKHTNVYKTAAEFNSHNIDWRDISETFLGNDCFHYPSEIADAEGLLFTKNTNRVDDADTLSLYTPNSAIEITYSHVENEASKVLHEGLANIPDYVTTAFVPGGKFTIKGIETAAEYVFKDVFTDDADVAAYAYSIDTYTNGWWCTLFEAPYPKTTENGIGESVGALHKRSTLNLQNLNETPSGGFGYTQPDSEELGQLDGIGFFFRFNISGLTINSFQGNIPFRCVMYDIFGGVWKSDFVIRFQNETQFIRLPFSGFTNYRSRLPVAFELDNWAHRVINPELLHTEIQDQFYIKRITFHMLYAYDEQGRYDPFMLGAIIHNIIPTITNTRIRYTGTVDAFHFTKAPLAIEKDTTSNNIRNTMGKIKQYPNVSNFEQLKKIAKSELDISRHQEDTIVFDIEDTDTHSVGPCSLVPEQSIYVKDQNIIAENEKGSTNAGRNTREYIVEKITYSLGDRSNGSDLVATILARRRVAQDVT